MNLLESAGRGLAALSSNPVETLVILLTWGAIMMGISVYKLNVAVHGHEA